MLVVKKDILNFLDILGTCRATKRGPTLRVPVYPKLQTIMPDNTVLDESVTVRICEFDFCTIKRPQSGLENAVVVKSKAEASLLPRFKPI